METDVTKKLFTVDEYHRMGEAGIFHPEEHVELIDGEIIEMSPIGYRHTLCVNRGNTFFVRAFGQRALVGPGAPVRLSDWTEPEPDIVVYKPSDDFYAKRRATIADILFLVEVADSSLSYDQNIKVPRYAAAGIMEVWVGDLQNDLLHVYRTPAGEAYRTVLIYRPGDSVSPVAFPDIAFRVDELLSTDCEE